MAKIDRDFLVPYLTDIFVLHLTLRKVKNIKSSKNAAFFRIEHEEYPAEPKSPVQLPLPMASCVFAALSGVGFAFMAICFLLVIYGWLAFGADFFFTLILLAITGGVALFLGAFFFERIEEIGYVKKRNSERMLAYYEAVKVLPDIRSDWKARKAKLPELKEEVEALAAEEEKLTKLLQKVYSVNIIPIQYRGFYDAVYLYRYIAYSYENDITEALKIYKLEQIKKKLDELIEQVEEVITNQYISLAEDRAAREAQRIHNQAMINKIDSMQDSADNIALASKICESNMETAAYYAEMTYLRKYF